MRTQRHAQWLPRSVAAAAVLLLAALLTAPAGLALAADNTAWDDIRAQLYGSEREIASGDGVIALEAPYRALDAATVPVVVTAQIPQTEDRYIKSLTLVVDDNPAPIVGTFHFSPANGIATISTRVRVNKSEEHTSELQSLMRISYAVFCLKKKTHKHAITHIGVRND